MKFANNFLLYNHLKTDRMVGSLLRVQPTAYGPFRVRISVPPRMGHDDAWFIHLRKGESLPSFKDFWED